MQSKTGSTLALISAIINYIGAGIFLLISTITPLMILVAEEQPQNGISNSTAAIIFFIIFFIIAAVFLTIGLLFHKASKKMKNPKTTKNGAIWALILGILTFGNIAGILGIVAGAIGLSDANK